MTNIQDARDSVFKAETELRTAREALDKEIQRPQPSSDAKHIIGYFEDFYGPGFNIKLVEEGKWDRPEIVVKIQYSDDRTPTVFASQCVVGKIHKLGYYLGCVRPGDNGIKLQFFKA